MQKDYVVVAAPRQEEEPTAIAAAAGQQQPAARGSEAKAAQVQLGKVTGPPAFEGLGCQGHWWQQWQQWHRWCW